MSIKQWVTELKAISPIDGELKRFCGPHVPGFTKKLAEEYCQNNGLGYLFVIGELIAEIPCKSGTFEPDFSKQINYDTPQKN